MSVYLQAQNTDLIVRGNPKTYLNSLASSGASTLSVQSIKGFAVSQWIQLENTGSEKCEMIKVHASTAPSGTTITLASNLVFDHSAGTPVTYIGFDQVEFSRATTVSGSKSVLATSNLTLDDIVTIYEDSTNTTGFGFYRFKNSAATTYSGYSDPIPYAGYDKNSVAKIIERSLSNAKEEISNRLTYATLISFVNDFISLMNTSYIKWSEAKVHSYVLDSVATGDWEYSLPTDIARDADPSAILAVWVNGYQPLTYVPLSEWRTLTQKLVWTQLSSALADTDVTVSLDNSYPFSDASTVLINGDTVTYTGNTRSTGTLTGVSGIATGGHAVDSFVFQEYTQGTPYSYTISENGKIRVWPIVGAEVNNRLIYIDYFKMVPEVDSLYDTVLISYPDVVVKYLTYRIKKYVEGGTISPNDPDFALFMKDFQMILNSDVSGQPIKIKLT